MKIYLISGKARHGKDTFASFLKEEYENHGKKVCLLGYSNYIKYYATKYFGWDGKEETKPRDLLQQLGTEVIRKKIDPMFHVNRIIEDIKVLSYFFDVAIIPDVRMPEELTVPKEKFDDVVTINVFRPNFDDHMNDRQKAHLTEVALDDYDDYDYKIVNDKEIIDLVSKAKEIVFNEEGYDE